MTQPATFASARLGVDRLRRLGSSLVRGPQALAALATAGGLLTASVVEVGDFTHSDGYFQVASLLLAIGLYGSAYGIDVGEARTSLRIVVPAVTIGVILKATLIAAVMYAAFREPEYLVLAVAVAQIDPLSVAALRRNCRLSGRARSILAAWSSFDDPVTVLVTVYFAALALRAGGRSTPGAMDLASPLDYGHELAVNLGLAGLVLVSRIVADRWLASPQPVPAAGLRRRLLDHPRWRQRLAVLALGGLILVAAFHFLMLGISLIGLVVRPVAERTVDLAVRSAFLVTGAALGLLLARGVDLVAGVTLGLVAFAAQAIVSLLLTRGLDREDRVGLALSQQNGITAIILALVLQPAFDRTVAIVGPAIVTINLVHHTANAWWQRRTAQAPGSPPDGVPVSPATSDVAVARRRSWSKTKSNVNPAANPTGMTKNISRLASSSESRSGTASSWDAT